MRKEHWTVLGLMGWCAAGAACGKADDVRFDGVAASFTSASGAPGTPDGSNAAASNGLHTQRSDAADAAVGSTTQVQLPPHVSLQEDVFFCGNAPCQCNNGIDDDGDGKIDGEDGECTGALDNDERTFATGIPGDNRDPKWQDCFFDGNSGAGDDRCRYPTGCLTGAIPQSDPACATTETCRNSCEPLAPEGCDCFGCCTVQLPTGGATDLVLSASCTLAKIDDTAACLRCTKSTACQGENPVPPAPTPQPPPDAGAVPPPDPPPPPPATECADQTPCSGPSDCATDQVCSLGCCVTQIR